MTCFNSSLSLRSTTYRFDVPTCLLLSSSFASSSSYCCCCCCCCCCAANNNNNRIYPSFLCNGLRQSTLIQFSPTKRLFFHRQSCTSTCDSHRNEKLQSFERGKQGGLRKGRYACWALEDKRRKKEFFSNKFDVEILLDLLTEEDHLGNNKDPTSKTKVVATCVKRDSNEVGSTKEEASIKGVNLNLNLNLNGEHKKQGSSCSSYYSVSSTVGEFQSQNDDEIQKHDGCFVRGESSKDDKKRDSSYTTSHDEENVQKFDKEESEILKKNTAQRYYGNQEWRKKSEKKLNIESSQHHQSLVSDQNTQHHSEKAEIVTNPSQSRTKYTTTSTENKLNTSVQEVTGSHTENEYTRQSNVISESSGIHEIDMRESSSSSSLEARMNNWEENSTQVSGQIEEKKLDTEISNTKNTKVSTQQADITRTGKKIDARMKNWEENENSTHQLTTLKDSRISSQQSDIRREEQQVHLETSEARMGNWEESSTQVSGQVEDRREEKLDQLKDSRVKSDTHIEKARVSIRKEKQQVHLDTSSSAEKVTTTSMKTGKRTTKASSFHIGMPKKASSTTYKALKLIPEPNLQETGAGKKSETVAEDDDAISSADQQQKSSTHFVGEFVNKAKHELSTSQVQQTYEEEIVYEDAEQHELKTPGEDGSRNSDQTDGGRGPSDEMWHETDNISSTANGESVKKGGRSLWNVIGDVVRLRWAAPRSEILHNSSSKDSPSSSSSNANQGSLSSSKNMSPSVIRMRRSPVVKTTSDEPDASGSGKMTEMPSADASGSGKMVIVDEQVKRRKLERIDQVSKDRFDEWEEAYTVETEQRKNDEIFMREALLEAKKAADFWEVPVGAVLVQDGKIIARGYNLVEELRDATAHAEMICIREASNNLRSWRLSGTTLYVTLEPCAMCAGAILQARIDTLVWGAPNKLLGADGSWIRLFPDGDGGSGSDKPAAPVHPFHPNMMVRRGVLSSDCADVMQQFFQLRRKKKTEAEAATPPAASCLPITHHHHRSKLFSKMHDAFSIMFCL